MNEPQRITPNPPLGLRHMGLATVIGVFCAVVYYLTSDHPEGAAIAFGISVAIGYWIGYPVGRVAHAPFIWSLWKMVSSISRRLESVSGRPLSTTQPPRSWAGNITAWALPIHEVALVAATCMLFINVLLAITGVETPLLHWSNVASLAFLSLTAYLVVVGVLIWIRARIETIALQALLRNMRNPFLNRFNDWLMDSA